MTAEVFLIGGLVAGLTTGFIIRAVFITANLRR
jgi:hypothetical protein